MEEEQGDFRGKRALVTGAAGGMGRELTSRLVKQGAKVVALDVRQESLDSLKEQVPEVETVCVDLLNWELTKEAVARSGPIDLLVNCAGIFVDRPMGQVDKEHLDRVLGINLISVINVSQVVASELVKRGASGSMVNVSSQCSSVAMPGAMAYCVSKAGVDMATKVLALEYGPHQIRTNAVNPTLVYTDMGVMVAAKNPALVQTMLERIPMGKMTEVENVVEAILFLLSDKAAMINGVTLAVDGGYKVT